MDVSIVLIDWPFRSTLLRERLMKEKRSNLPLSWERSCKWSDIRLYYLNVNFFYCFIFTLIVYLPGCTVHPNCIRAFFVCYVLHKLICIAFFMWVFTAVCKVPQVPSSCFWQLFDWGAPSKFLCWKRNFKVHVQTNNERWHMFYDSCA